MTLFRRRLFVTLLFLLAVTIAGGLWLRFTANADALWHIVHDECSVHQTTQYRPAPCASVNLAQGYAVFKDRNGPLQYLLLPTARISGIESPALLAAQQTNFFAAAWRERHFLEQKLGRPIPPQFLSFTVNSRYGRTQNQLHIHMSCLKPAVRAQLSKLYPQLNARWQPIDNGINGNRYWARTLNVDELMQNNPFLLLANGLPDARRDMALFGLALVPINDQAFILLATRRQLWRMNLASIEEIQDHRCTELYRMPA